jgi:histidyl-tRNA synthetase
MYLQWNMDVLGVADVDAEAELLSAAVLTFKSMGLTSEDIRIKVFIYFCSLFRARSSITNGFT